MLVDRLFPTRFEKRPEGHPDQRSWNLWRIKQNLPLVTLPDDDVLTYEKIKKLVPLSGCSSSSHYFSRIGARATLYGDNLHGRIYWFLLVPNSIVPEKWVKRGDDWIIQRLIGSRNETRQRMGLFIKKMARWTECKTVNTNHGNFVAMDMTAKVPPSWHGCQEVSVMIGKKIDEINSLIDNTDGDQAWSEKNDSEFPENRVLVRDYFEYYSLHG